MAKKAAAQNGRADLPVSQDMQQCVSAWHASHYVKGMLDQISCRLSFPRQLSFTGNRFSIFQSQIFSGRNYVWASIRHIRISMDCIFRVS
jgi:hypothetical protein